MNQLEQPPGSRVLPITSIITLLGFLDTFMLVPVMALYASELGAGVGIVGLIIGLYSITNTPSNILFGRLIDRVGYKVPLTAGVAIGAPIIGWVSEITGVELSLALSASILVLALVLAVWNLKRA